jgi:hypothetical protein
MNRGESYEIAQKMSYEDLRIMLDRARRGIIDWHAPSKVYKPLTLGAAFNIISRLKEDSPIGFKAMAIREYEEYIPRWITIPESAEEKESERIHQDPVEFKL